MFRATILLDGYNCRQMHVVQFLWWFLMVRVHDIRRIGKGFGLGLLAV